jgi:hypothetical protein
MATISEFRILSVKDIQILLQCSEGTARQYLKDIQEATGAPKVLYKHFEYYFKLGKFLQ